MASNTGALPFNRYLAKILANRHVSNVNNGQNASRSGDDNVNRIPVMLPRLCAGTPNGQQSGAQQREAPRNQVTAHSEQGGPKGGQSSLRGGQSGAGGGQKESNRGQSGSRREQSGADRGQNGSNGGQSGAGRGQYGEGRAQFRGGRGGNRIVQNRNNSVSGRSTPTDRRRTEMGQVSVAPVRAASVDRSVRQNNPARGGGRYNAANSGRESNRPNDHNPRRRFDKSYMGFQRLENFVTMDPEQLVLILLNEETGLDTLLKTDLSNDYIVLILRIINRFCESAFNQNKGRLLVKFCQKEFIDKLTLYINNLLHQGRADKNRNKYFWSQPDNFWENVMTFYDCVINLIPNTAVESFPKLIKATCLVAVNMDTYQNTPVQDSFKQKLASMQEKLDLCQDEREKQKQVMKHVVGDEGEPPDDFRDIPLYPLVSEVTTDQRSFIRRNIIKGGYTSVDHYLDVQFRLLREDFVAPLRLGICSFIQQLRDKQRKRLFNVRIYQQVLFVGKQHIQDKVASIVQFHRDPAKQKLKLEHSKRFMYGSLVCFSNDGFKSIVFGTVVNRDLKLLKDGKIAVEVLGDVYANQEYIMVESTVYFESYFYVLRALQLLDEDKFPMKNYIVNVQPIVQYPSYLSYRHNLKHMGFSFSPLNKFYWPSARELELDESQYKAFHSAVTREFCVIQGPPGTGKTYIGLKVAEILIENVQVWRESLIQTTAEDVETAVLPTGPILVICFTNHALDQFLEGILKFTKKLVRVGGQSKNEALNNYNIRNVRMKVERQKISASLLHRKRDEISDSLRTIAKLQGILNAIIKKDSIINFDYFVDIDQELRDSWFIKAKRNECIDWLLGGRTADERAEELRRNNLAEARARMQDGNDDNNDSDSDEFFDMVDETVGRLLDDKEILLTAHDMDFSDMILTSVEHLNQQIRKLTTSLTALETVNTNTYALYDEKFALQLSIERTANNLQYMQMRFNQYAQKTHPRRPAIVDYEHPELLRPNDRWGLYFFWEEMLQNLLSEKLVNLEAEYRTTYREFEEVKQIEDIRIMKDMLVLGMTTTGAARYQASLQALKCPIVIVEEAAEVLESHIVVSLTKDCKHLILIGDHQQLRPTTSEYRLAKDYHLEISLFERMLQNGIHCEQLEVQHRMRPEIVRLIVPAIYPKLENHISVETYPPVMGVDKNVFFITHTQPEEEVSDSGSKRNVHEAKFLIRLARHFILQGYEPSDITILATYSGQMFCLWKEKKLFPQLDAVRITVVDNFQGEENKIILLSLVRSNDSDAIGFLKIDNRVCVALSRAKEGLFIIGNMDILQKSHNVWPNVRAVLQEQESIGTHLLLRCQIHPEQVTLVAKAEDFQQVPEGGCTLMCGKQLICGHVCSSLCHISDRAHDKYKCKNRCNRLLCELEHQCPDYCFEKCKPCYVPLEVILPCEHVHMLPCHCKDKLDTYNCPTLVPVELECGHSARKPCHKKKDEFACPHPCDVRLDCGHACVRKCHIHNDPDHLETKCYKPCPKIRSGCTADHKCPLRCHETCPPCDYFVKKKRSKCGHNLEVRCFEDPNDIVCTKKCNKKMECGHICISKCNEPCSYCPVKVRKVIGGCGHTVEAKCSDAVSRAMCRGKCPRSLPCGHRCTRRCFEDCNTKCYVLVNNPVTAACGHVFQVPCHEKDLEFDPYSFALLKHCKQQCNTILKCGHKCSGTCGECVQGRLHKTCQEKCGNVLVCGHECEVPCREVCQPCSKKCTYKCAHSRCGKKCGEPCRQCTEPCLRRCQHVRCTRKCSDICDCDPCAEPCPRLLKCGHPCLGYCGDVCPPVCRVCDPENEAFEIFFGNEGDEDARFVYLEECRHSIEANAMDQWLSQKDDGEINNKTCPRCKTIITRTQRYSDYIKAAYKDVIAVKRIHYGNFQKNDEKRYKLLEQLNNFLETNRDLQRNSKNFRPLITTLQISLAPNKKGKKNTVNKLFLNTSEKQIELIDLIVKIYTKLQKLDRQNVKCLKQLDFLLDILLKQNSRITEQETADMHCEINRFEKIVKVAIIEKNRQFPQAIKTATVKTLHENVGRKLQSIHKFTDHLDKEINQDIKQLCAAVDESLKLTDAERNMVVRAMGMSKGHWYKCPNGHYYCIGECGGAMQVSRCNECGAKIGGQNHRLESRNQHAGEMDGSTQPAWPGTLNNNMQNFMFDM